MTPPTADYHRDDLPRRRVVVCVVCDVPAATRSDAAGIAVTTVRRALDVAPNRVRRGPLAHGPRPVLRHLVRDRVEDPRDVAIGWVEDLALAVLNRLVALVPLGDPEPLDPPTEEHR